MEPTFLGLDDVLRIHRRQLELYGGTAGVRDMGLLESAVAMSAAGFGDEYLHKDIYEMAAADRARAVGKANGKKAVQSKTEKRKPSRKAGRR